MPNLITNLVGDSYVSKYTGSDSPPIPLLKYFNRRNTRVVVYNKSNKKIRLETAPIREGPWQALQWIKPNVIIELTTILPFLRLKTDGVLNVDVWIVQYN
jgi:hypothetical protein